MPLTSGTLAPIGAGGMGEVYKARDARLEHTPLSGKRFLNIGSVILFYGKNAVAQVTEAVGIGDLQAVHNRLPLLSNG